MVQRCKITMRPFKEVHCEDLDNDFEMAFEVIFDDLKSEFTSVSPNSCTVDSLSQFGPAVRDFEKTYNISNEDELVQFLKEKNSEDPYRQYTTRDDGCRAVPSPSLNAWDDNIKTVTCSLWDEKEYTDVSTLHSQGSIRRSRTESISYEVPNITDQMNEICLFDNASGRLHDMHINFMDLKRSYSTNDLELNNQTMVFLKASCAIERVVVYLKEWEDESSAISFGPLKLKSNFDQAKGMLTVFLDSVAFFPSSYLQDRHTKWQLCVVTIFQDGESQSCCSSTFQMEDFTSIKNESLDNLGNVYNQDGIQNSENASDVDCVSSPARSRISSESEASMVTDDRANQELSITLLPGSQLCLQNIKHELAHETDTTHIQEQPDFAGLLKIVKRKIQKDATGRRRANGFRSAEEAFQWACGHCLFRRPKKSTVRSHVLRRVCKRNRRVFAESHFREHRQRVPLSRSYTFPGMDRRVSDDDVYSLPETP